MLNILLLTFIFASNIKASHDSTEKNIPNNNSHLNSAEKIQLTPSQIVSTAKDSVAQIYAFKKGISVSPFSGDYQMDPFWDNFFKGFLKDFEKEKIHSGSGFLISIEGEEGTYVVTCNHVVRNANKIIIKIENKIYLTKLVYRESDSDIAILKVESKDKLPVLQLGDSHSISSGDEVLAFGYPFELEQVSVTSGIISAKNIELFPRLKKGQKISQIVIQTDAPMNPGNSGGPLVDRSGKVIAVNSAIYSTTGGSHGVGFAVPVSFVKAIINEIKKQDKAFFAINVTVKQNHSQIEKIQEPGKVIVEFSNNEALQVGDQILKIRGDSITSINLFNFHQRTSFAGENVSFVIKRGDEILNINVITQSKKSDQKNQKRIKRLSGEFNGYQVEESKDGVLIIEAPESATGIEVGDTILEMNGIKVNTLSDLEEAIKKKGTTFSYKLRKADGGFSSASFTNSTIKITEKESNEEQA